MSKASDKTYNQFVTNPATAPSYLRPHYDDGCSGVNKPPKTQKLAMAAWRAGRDTMAAATQLVGAAA